MNTNQTVAIGALVGIGAFLLFASDASASNTIAARTPKQPKDPLPKPDHVPGADLNTNWGKTPEDLRPLFVAMERVSGITGSARIFSVIAWGESRWINTAHNNDSKEIAGSRAAIENRKNNPKLKYEQEAADFGSGGLFGALAPYFLWTGVPEIGTRAPLLDAPPTLMFTPRYAAFAAIVYLKRLIRGYDLIDHLDIKVGWANPSILRNRSGSYQDIRNKFQLHATTVGIDLNDTTTIPKTLNADQWPGILPAYRQMTGDKLYEFARVV